MTDRLAAHLDELAGQKRKAAEYIVGHPREIAVYSLRKIALRARVSPGTLVLLAKMLGYETYNAFRAEFQEGEVGVLNYFTASAKEIQVAGASTPLKKLANIIATADMKNIESTIDAANVAAISAAARVVHESRQVYVLGRRATFGVTQYLYYMLQLVRSNVVLLDDAAALAGDRLDGVGADDVLIVCGFYPYLRSVIDLTDQAEAAQMKIVAMTDSPKSPLARKKGTMLLIRTDSPWVFGSITSSVVLSQILVAQITALGGEAILERVRQREVLLQNLDIYAP